MSQFSNAPEPSQKKAYKLKPKQPRGPYTPDEWAKKQALLAEKARKEEEARKAAAVDGDDTQMQLRRRKNEHRMKSNLDRPGAASKRGRSRK
jgi:hypothetical protein